MDRPVARIAYLVLALVTLSGVVTSMWLAWRDPGVFGPIGAFAVTAMAQLEFFTNLSNVLVLIFATQLVVARDWTQTWHVLRLSGTTCIMITGVVYNLLLGGHGTTAIGQYNNVIVHIVVPILTPLLWLVFGPRETTWRRVLLAMVLPVAWLTVTMVRGAVTGWYPYYFLDPFGMGATGVVRHILAILAFYFVVTLGMWAVDRLSVGRGGPRTR